MTIAGDVIARHFSTLRPDALLALIGLHAADPRADQIDVGVCAYRDAQGRTPVLRAVKQAEQRLLCDQASKSYLGPDGDARFTELLALIALGPELATSPNIVGLQTPGGTGALRHGAELLALSAPGRSIWVGMPNSANHIPLLKGAGLQVQTHQYFDEQTSDIHFPAMLEELDSAQPGDIVLLHACCHNPTGASFSTEQWAAIAELCSSRSLMPFVDLAYQGLGLGLEEDAAGFRALLRSVPEAIVAYNCDKSFGLYGDRWGALWVQAATSRDAQAVQSNLHALARINWSMPPDHGAAVVRTILDDTVLHTDWCVELSSMARRIRELRCALAAGHERLAPIARQAGMFALLPLVPSAIAELGAHHAIYIPGNGHINIAGLSEIILDDFVSALAPFLDKRA